MASDEVVPPGALSALEALKWPKCQRCGEFMPVGECRVIFSASVTAEGKFAVNLLAAHMPIVHADGSTHCITETP
jgi:hypothetical protein